MEESGMHHLGYEVGFCKLHEGSDYKLLDVNGNHAIACSSTYRSRSQTHSNFNHIIKAFCEEAELTVTLEPPTHTVLVDEYSSAECRNLFQRNPSAATREKAASLFDYMTQLQDPMIPEGRRLEVIAATEALIREIPIDATGLRVDVFACQPDGHGTSFLLDASITHETKISTRPAMLKWARDLIQNNQLILLGEDGSFEHEPSPAVAKVIASKHNRYKLLSHIANVQKAAGKRPDNVAFTACVMSHAGEMAPEFISLVEKLSQRMRPIHSNPDCLSGLSPSQAAHDFRRRMMNALATGMAKGWGRQLRCAGFNNWKDRIAGRGRV